MKLAFLILVIIIPISCNYNTEGINIKDLDTRFEEWGERTVDVYYEKDKEEPYSGKVYDAEETSAIEPQREYFRSRGELLNGVKNGKWYEYVGYDELVHYERSYQSGRLIHEIKFNVTEGHEGEKLFEIIIKEDTKYLKWFGWCGQSIREKIVRISTNETLLDRENNYCD